MNHSVRYPAIMLLSRPSSTSLVPASARTVLLVMVAVASAAGVARAQDATSLPALAPMPPERPFGIGSKGLLPVPSAPEVAPRSSTTSYPGAKIAYAPTPDSSLMTVEPEWPRRTSRQTETFDPAPQPRPPDAVQTGRVGITTDLGTTYTCLPTPLTNVLGRVVERFGGVHITSTLRPPHRARRGSYHRRCEAVDFRVPNVSPRTVLAFVRTMDEVGGRKVYPNGLIHLDTGPQRSW